MSGQWHPGHVSCNVLRWNCSWAFSSSYNEEDNRFDRQTSCPVSKTDELIMFKLVLGQTLEYYDKILHGMYSETKMTTILFIPQCINSCIKKISCNGNKYINDV